MPLETVLAKLIGKWKGDCRTWFEPGQLADESEVAGEFEGVYNDFVRHTYSGQMQGKPRSGEDLLAFNSVTNNFESAWIDDFHMSYAILFSQGKALVDGFSVLGHYDVGGGEPAWGWRTEFKFADDDHLTITAYNIMPASEEAKAVETTYTRVK